MFSLEIVNHARVDKDQAGPHSFSLLNCVYDLGAMDILVIFYSIDYTPEFRHERIAPWRPSVAWQQEDRMMRKLLIIITLVSLSPPAAADDRDKTLFAMAGAHHQWHSPRADMLAADYERSTRNNLEVLEQGLTAWSTRMRNSGAAYVPVVGMVGAAVSLAARDQRYSLNDSKTVGLVLRDSTDSDRSLLFEYRKIW